MSRQRRRQFCHRPSLASLCHQESLHLSITKKPHIWRQSTQGNHAPLGREEEEEVDPAPGSDIEMRGVGPDRDRDQRPLEICPSPTFSVYVHTYAV